jgi:hypothetical protein
MQPDVVCAKHCCLWTGSSRNVTSGMVFTSMRIAEALRVAKAAFKNIGYCVEIFTIYMPR